MNIYIYVFIYICVGVYSIQTKIIAMYILTEYMGNEPEKKKNQNQINESPTKMRRERGNIKRILPIGLDLMVAGTSSV